MKRIFIHWILGAAALLAVGLLAGGCVAGMRTEKIPVNIGFRPVIGHDTRAEESVPFPEDRSFRVWAIDTHTGQRVLNDETISHSAGGWLASKTWPETELEFTACWPTDLAPEYSADRGIVIRDFSATTKDIDLLLARNTCDYEADSLVVLNFEHILSKVDLRVKHSLEDNIEVIIRKIEFAGFALSGDYGTEEAGTWTAGTNTENHTIYEDPDGNGWPLTGDATYIGEAFYAVPQQCTAEIVMTCDVRVGNGGWIPDRLSTGHLHTDWESGKMYTYTITMTDTQLTYTTGISNWNNRDFE